MSILVHKEDVEAYNKNNENYGRSIFSHEDDEVPFNYEGTIKHFNDEDDGYPSYGWDDGATIKHFQD